MLGQRTRRPDTSPSWSRQRMLVLLAAAGLVAVLLVAGLVVAVTSALRSSHHPSDRADHDAGAAPGAVSASGAVSQPDGGATSGGGAVSPRQAQDALAARPMPQVGLTAAEPGPVSTRDPGAPILLPTSSGTGPAGVASGFPRTVAGAMAQMAAIDQTALQSGSLDGARAVITAWALPGGPTASSWSGVAALAQFFDAAGLSGGGSPQLSLVMTPLMGLVKGSVGPDFVIPCVDFEIDATLTTTARVGIADCERMAWAPNPSLPSGGRWMVGPGAEPADPPSVWPDTDTALRVGYHDLRTTGHGHA
jgi:hypothetical protein